MFQNDFRKRLTASCAIMALATAMGSPALAADYVISTPVTTTNGGNTVDGNDSITVTGSGSISTTAVDAYGIYGYGGHNTIANSGSIATQGIGADGIYARGGNSSIANSGSITTQADHALGINVRGGSNTITSSGTIATQGDFSQGIYARGNANTITSTGAITTQGDTSHGVYAYGNYNTITNSGSITTQGYSNGIFTDGAHNTIVNSGMIETHKGNAKGISTRGQYATVTNSGSIATTGNYADGIYGASDFNTITNSGSITTQGSGANGIYLYSDNNTITNSGSITTQGTSAKGIYVYGKSNTITNSGRIVSTKSDSIFFNANNNTLNLLAPSFLGGRIKLGGGTKVNIVSGPSHSILWDLSAGSMVGGAPNLSGPVPIFYNATTKQVATFDPSGLAGTVDQLGDTTFMLFAIGRTGLTGGTPVSSGQTASALSGYTSDTDGYEENRIANAFAGQSTASAGRFWITGFGGSVAHDGSTTTLDRTSTQYGVAFGYNWQYGGDWRLGVMGGYLAGNLEASSRWTTSQDVDSEGWFAGLNAASEMGSVRFDFGLLAGVMSHDGKRFVNDNLAPSGVSWARYSNDSWFVSPEAGISADLASGGGWTLTPSARIRYAMESFDGYSETGSSANASVGSYTAGLLEENVEIAASKHFDFGKFTGRLGYLARQSTGDDSANVSMIQTTNTVGFGGTDVNTGYLGASLETKLTALTRLELNGNFFIGNGMTGVQGSARITASF